MSQWTHVCGMIRTDFVDFTATDPNGQKEREKIENALGPISTYKHRCITHAPCGSEGSIKWKIVENDDNYINKFNIMIWGDLRDYGDEEDLDKIKSWFKNVCKTSMMIRDAVLHVHVEFNQGLTLLYHNHGEDTPKYKETVENLKER